MHLLIIWILIIQRRLIVRYLFPISYQLFRRSHWDSVVVLRHSNMRHHDYLFKYSEYVNVQARYQWPVSP